MKKIVSIILVLCLSHGIFAQDITSLWRQVNKEMKEGKFKSTQKKLDQIYTMAEQQKDMPNFIKALILQSKIAVETSDDKDVVREIQAKFLSQIKKAKGEEKAVLQIYLAQLYANYWSENRYRIGEQTSLAFKENQDFREWPQNLFNQEIDTLIHNALGAPRALNQPIGDWKILTQQSQGEVDTTPTLYDLLVQQSLSMMQRDGVNKDFVLSIYDKAIAHSQERLYYLLGKWRKEYDYQRISKEEYKENLQGFIQDNQANSWAAQAAYERALLSENKVESYTLCREYEHKFPHSYGGKNCAYLANKIAYPSLEVTGFQSWLPQEHNALYITSKNITQLAYEVYRVPMEKSKELDEYRNNSAQLGLKRIRAGKIALKKFTDYKEHTTVFAFPSLPEGNYVIYIRDVSGKKNKAFVSQRFVVSSYFVNKALGAKENQWNIWSKNKGESIPNKKFELWEHPFNKWQKVGDISTNEKGQINLQHKNSYERYYLLNPENQMYYPLDLQQYYERKETNEDRLNIFTDRKIYRPGQRVYFKGILYNTHNAYQTIAQKEVVLWLKDANNQEIKKISLKTNDFGSVHGSFQLPTTGVTGRFSIVAENPRGITSFGVEEYKRPKFKVNLVENKQKIQFNDTVKIKGIAEMFSGAKLANAKVVYSVVRREEPIYYCWWRPYNFPETTLTQGEITTNHLGEFEVLFKALPESEFTQEDKIYNYHIEVAVTGISGETHTAEENVRIGNIPFRLQIETQQEMLLSEMSNIEIKAINLNGKKIKAQGELSITKLQDLNRIIIPTPGQEKMDYALYNQQEFVQKLPHIAYKEEDISQRQKEKVVFLGTFNTEKTANFQLEKKLSAGFYELKAKSSYNGKEVESIQYVRIIDDERLSIDKDTYFVARLEKDTYFPGEKATVFLGSSAQEALVKIVVGYNEVIVSEQEIALGKRLTKVEIPIKEEYRGGLYVYYYFTKFNYIEKGTLSIKVPFDNKKLSIKTKTFRSKLKPNDKEKWQFVIQNSQEKNVVAEVLASMYDQSLDSFAENQWQFSPYNRHYATGSYFPGIYSRFRTYNHWYNGEMAYLGKSRLDLFGLSLSEYRRLMLRGMRSMKNKSTEEPEMMMAADIPVPEAGEAKNNEETSFAEEESSKKEINFRKNFQETAFFYPDLVTDNKGNLLVEFTAPESLTSWKFQVLATTPALEVGYLKKEVLTQKELMISLNAPRFLRQGDQITLVAQIDNLSSKEIEGEAELELINPITLKPITAEFRQTKSVERFSVKKGSNTSVSWQIKIPKEIDAVIYRVYARGAKHSDGEENILPVLANRTMITDAMPVYIREGQEKRFVMNPLEKAGERDNYKLTFEFTQNPTWFAIMALPYLNEVRFDNTEAVFQQFFSNQVSREIVKAHPQIEQVFEDWKKKNQLVSPLHKNTAFKSIATAETPWVMEAKNESEQMQQIAMLFNDNYINHNLSQSFDKLSRMQLPNGGFPWFSGGRDNLAISLSVLEGLGRLKAMQVEVNHKNYSELKDNLINYLDQKIKEVWQEDVSKNKSGSVGIVLKYLYARNEFIAHKPLSKKILAIKNKTLDYYKKEPWKRSMAQQALLALVWYEYGEKQQAKKLIEALKERAVISDEMGMYWKANSNGDHWFTTPVENQALLIEAFDRVAHDQESVALMKVWLLKNKQTNRWENTKATASAIYALMSFGENWTQAENNTQIKIGGEEWKPTQEQKASGYAYEQWNEKEIKPKMGEITLKKETPGVAWGALYYQYFEDLDQVESTGGGIKVKKEIYRVIQASDGEQLSPIKPQTPIHVGDLLRVRIVLQADREMEFVHLKDLRASGLEPTSVISRYKWQNGIGYYQSTKDAATHFFIDFMPKGVYVFEYDLAANNAGDFSNGFTQLQSFYAPEFLSRTQGERLSIEP